jgi:uncharacterized membrane protein
MKKLSVLFLLMGILYAFIEVIATSIPTISTDGWRLVGHTSLWMCIVGGVLGVTLGMFNQIKAVRKNCNVFWQAIVGAVVIVLGELISGYILNIVCGFNIWDYSDQPFNFMGQISLIMGIGWFFISPLAFWVDDTLRYYFYKEGKSYSLWAVYKELFNPFKKTSFQSLD